MNKLGFNKYTLMLLSSFIIGAMATLCGATIAPGIITIERDPYAVERLDVRSRVERMTVVDDVANVWVSFSQEPTASPSAEFVFRNGNQSISITTTEDQCSWPVYDVDDRVTYVEYIESTGTQWIDTGVPVAGDISVKLDFDFGEATPKRILGVNDVNGSYELMWSHYIYCYTGLFLDRVEYNFVDGARSVIEFTPTFLRINESTLLTWAMGAWQGSRTMYLFGVNEDGSKPLSSYRIYDCEVDKLDITLRKFRPAIDLEGVACLYDTVSKTYFYNQGTGVFLHGDIIQKEMFTYKYTFPLPVVVNASRIVPSRTVRFGGVTRPFECGSFLVVDHTGIYRGRTVDFVHGGVQRTFVGGVLLDPRRTVVSPPTPMMRRGTTPVSMPEYKLAFPIQQIGEAQ